MGKEMTEKEAISRVRRSKAAARTSYDRMSGWYDWMAGSSEKAFTDLGLELLCVQPGEHVLEIGCGTGHSLLALSQAAGATGQVYGLDLSSGMLRQSANRIRQAQYGIETQLIAGDAAHLPLLKNSLDAIFMSFTLELFDTPEIPQVLDECRRALRKTGRLGVVSLQKSTPPSRMLRLYEWAHQRFPNAIDCRPIFVLRSLEQSGFQLEASIERNMWGLPVTAALARPGLAN
jgi:ubiquinone/menaquinone biosynthesis C-methylase UbiE